MALTIRKTIEGEFEHIRSNGTVLDGSPNATAIGSSVNFKTRNGARIALREPISGITVIDVASASNETFSTTTELFIRLRALGYFNQGGGTLTGGSSTFQGLTDTVVALPYVDNQIPIAENGNLVMKDIPNAFGVSSWNGLTGNVNVSTANLPEDPNGLVNLYFTDARVSANADVIANSTHRNRTDNPHSVTQAQVNLPNVDNTSDINKPISTAQEVRFQSIESKIAIIRNGDFATLANVQADTSLQTDITDNAGVPLAVFNEDGRIFIYNAGTWKENEADEVFVVDNVASFPATGDLDTLYKVRGATPELYNWNGATYVLIGGGTADGNDTPIPQGDAIEDVEPTALQVPNPENGDTASKYLTSGKLEKWLYTTSWAKAWVLSSTVLSNGSGTTANGSSIDIDGALTKNGVINFGDSEDIAYTLRLSSIDGQFLEFGVNQMIFQNPGAGNARFILGSSIFMLNDSTVPAIPGQVWTAVDVSGEGAWQSLPSSSGLIDGLNTISSNSFQLRRDGSGSPVSVFSITGGHNAGSPNTDIVLGDVGAPAIQLLQSTSDILIGNDGGNGVGVFIRDNAYRVDVQASYVQLLDSTVPDMEAAPGIALPTKDWVESKITGASGSFTAQSGETITVVDGLITNIV